MAQENRSVYWSVTVYSFVAVQWCCPAVNEEFPAADTGTSTRTTRVAGTVTFVPYKLTDSSAQSLDRFGRQGDTTDDTAETLFQSFLQEAIVSSSALPS